MLVRGYIIGILYTHAINNNPNKRALETIIYCREPLLHINRYYIPKCMIK